MIQICSAYPNPQITLECPTQMLNLHYLMECPLFNVYRNSLINQIGQLTNINTDILLYGNPELNLDENRRVFDAVHDFITNTRRFD